MRKKQNQKLNQNVLQNKISRELFVLGKNSIIEIFDTYFQDFECLIIPDKYSASKIQTLVDRFHSKGIPVYKDSNLLGFAQKALTVDYIAAMVLLKRPIGKYFSMRDIKSILESMDTCTVVAIPEVDYEQNLGAMIRTSLALNVDFLLISNRQQKVFSSTVTKVSMGYNYILPVVQENFLLAIDELKDIGFQIVGLDMGGENILNFRYNPKACIVMGCEGAGLSSTVLSKCDSVVSIPMNEVVESMNVNASLGIALYDRVSKLKG